MPLRSGGAIDNEYARGRANLGLVCIGGKILPNLYAGYEGSWAGETDVARVTMDPFEKVAERTDMGDMYHHLLPTSRGIYDFSGWANPGRILLLDPETLATLASVALLTGERYIWGNAEKDNYLYAGLSYTLGSRPIIRCTKDPFSRLDSLIIGENAINATLVIDGDTMYCITTFSLTTEKIIKIDLPSFTKGDVLATAESIVDGLHPDALIHDEKLYFGTYTTPGTPGSPGAVVKVDLPSFTVEDKLNLQAGEIYARGLLIKDGYLYVGCRTFPGKIVKIRLEDFTEVDTLTLATDEDFVLDMQIYGDILYALMYADSGWDGNYLVRVDLRTFTRIDSLWMGDEAWFAVDLKIA